VFEAAGMRRIGRCADTPEQQRALAELRAVDVDPFAHDFERTVCRSRRVREIVSGVVARWYGATTGGGADRVRRQSPAFMARLFRGLVGSRPVYFLWERRDADAAGAAGGRVEARDEKIGEQKSAA
jgi:hypothetical protein